MPIKMKKVKKLYISIPKDPINDKGEIVDLISNMIVDDIRIVYDRQEGIRFKEELDNYNNSRMESGYYGWISELDYNLASFIKKSVKTSYGGNRIFGLSTEEKCAFVTDLRNAIRKIKIYE
jgi:hypothetical protein